MIQIICTASMNDLFLLRFSKNTPGLSDWYLIYHPLGIILESRI
ncbi:hypothetical protein [Methanospirillum lacunae]